MKHQRAISFSSLNSSSPNTSVYFSYLFFIIGVMLPFISFDTSTGTAASTSFFSRVAIVDLLVVITVFLMFLSMGVKITRNALLYAFCILLSLFIAFLNNFIVSQAKEINVSQSSNFVSFIALAMAFGYWLIGYNCVKKTGNQFHLIWLINGILLGLVLESIIGFHDYLFPSWFYDPEELRVRGTFRKSGQLAAYAFSICGLFFSLSFLEFDLKKKKWYYAACVLGFLLCMVTTRRSALLALIVWVILFAFLPPLFDKKSILSKHTFKIIIALSIILITFVSFKVKSLMDTYFAFRMIQGYEKMVNLDRNAAYVQALYSIENISLWFPFGLGAGNGYKIMPEIMQGSIDTPTMPGSQDESSIPDLGGIPESTGVIVKQQEIHNGWFSLLVEMGVQGFICFTILIISPIRHANKIRMNKAFLQFKWAAVSFLLSSFFIFQIHNRLHRDRTFLLFLGIITAYIMIMKKDQYRNNEQSFRSNNLKIKKSKV